jgi:hypothetical protein
MKILRWTSLMIALAAAVVVTGCGVEVYDSPGYPGRHHGGWRGYGDRAGDVQGTVLRVSRRDHVIVVDPGDDREGSRNDRHEIVLFYDDSTTVEYQGRDFRPEDLERGDRIQASVDWQGDRGVAEDIQVTYDASSGRGGEAPDRPSRPDREDSHGQDEPSADLQGTIRSVDASAQSLEIEPASDDSEDSDSSGRPAGVVMVRYDAQTTVQFQGRSYRPENLEPGDVVAIHLRRSRGGRPVADQILVIGDARQARPSRTSIGSTGSRQTPSSRQPRISSNPASTSDQKPRFPVLLGK